MLDVINLALPFFDLIFLGFGCGKFKAIPDSGLAWMDFFILYVALPALFYRIVAQTPLEQLGHQAGHAASADGCHHAGDTVGRRALRASVALDRLMQFLQNAAAPTALFTRGVTVALRPLNKMPWDVPLTIMAKLIVHPTLAFTLLSLLGPFAEIWVYTAVLMAALPPALNVFVFARQYDVWVEQASSAVLFGTLISVATLTSVMWLVKTQQLPVRLFHGLAAAEGHRLSAKNVATSTPAW
jgi:predicted permease